MRRPAHFAPLDGAVHEPVLGEDGIGFAAAVLPWKLRSVFGVQARCEFLLWLLTHERGHPADIARATYYFPRTVEETLREFAASGLVHNSVSGRAVSHWVQPEEWLFLRGWEEPRGFPRWIDWPRLFHVQDRLITVGGAKDMSPLPARPRSGAWSRNCCPWWRWPACAPISRRAEMTGGRIPGSLAAGFRAALRELLGSERRFPCGNCRTLPDGVPAARNYGVKSKTTAVAEHTVCTKLVPDQLPSLRLRSKFRNLSRVSVRLTRRLGYLPADKPMRVELCYARLGSAMLFRPNRTNHVPTKDDLDDTSKNNRPATERPKMPTFEQAYCEKFGGDPGRFRHRLFRELLPWQARMLEPLLGGIEGSYFAPDFNLIVGAGEATTVSRVRDEIRDYFNDPANRRWLRRTLRVRVSTMRLDRIARSLLPIGNANAFDRR